MIYSIVVDIAVCAFLGAMIGFACRGRVLAEVSFSIAASLSYLILTAWIAGTLSKQLSVLDPIGSTVYLLIPYLCFYLLPTLVLALIVGLARRRKSLL